MPARFRWRDGSWCTSVVENLDGNAEVQQQAIARARLRHVKQRQNASVGHPSDADPVVVPGLDQLGDGADAHQTSTSTLSRITSRAWASPMSASRTATISAPSAMVPRAAS